MHQWLNYHLYPHPHDCQLPLYPLTSSPLLEIQLNVYDKPYEVGFTERGRVFSMHHTVLTNRQQRPSTVQAAAQG
jgi:hypothetical protein